MIEITNPSHNVILLEDVRDLGRTFKMSYYDSKLIWSIETKSPIKIFIIPSDNVELYNIFNKFIFDIKYSQIYRTDFCEDNYDTLNYLNIGSLEYNLVYENEDGEDMISVYDEVDEYPTQMIKIFNSNNEILIAFNPINSDKIDVVIKTSESIIGDFYMPFLRLFEALLDSENLKQVRRRQLKLQGEPSTL